MTPRILIRRFLARLASCVIPPEWSSSLLLWELKNKILRFSGMKIGPGVGIAAGFTSVPGCEEKLEIGAFSGLAYGANIINLLPVRIGDYSTLAAEVTLAPAGPGVSQTPARTGQGLSIGRGCWIGNGAQVIGPITIGDHAIIGAGAVVMEDVPPGAIAAGVPAKIIRYRNLPDKVWLTPDLLLDPKTFELYPHPVQS